MHVVVTDRPFPQANPYGGVLHDTDNLYDGIVKRTGDEITYAGCNTEGETRESCRDASVIITFNAPITEHVLEATSEVRLIIRQGAGYENIDVQAATVRGIPVSNAPDYGSADVSSHGIALALAASHNVVKVDRGLREGLGWGSSRMIQSIQGKTYAIVGLGRIGRQAVSMARGLGMEVIVFDPLLDDDIFEERDVEQVSFEELLGPSNCITLHAPLNTETHYLFSTAEFHAMKESTILVNVARGSLVDKESLVTAIENDEIRGAGLDVFESEPQSIHR